MVVLHLLLLLTPLLNGCTDENGSTEAGKPDGMAPVASIIFPGTAALLTSGRVTVRGTAQGQHAITGVAVNGVPATSMDGFATWVAQVTLPLGMSEVVVSTTEAVGNTEARAAVALVTVVETLLPFLEPTGMAVEPSGTLVVVDNDLKAVVRVNPQTGARTIISDATTGSGPQLLSLSSIAVEAAGTLVVAGGVPGAAVVRVEPQTGARTIVSDATTGSGPPLPSTSIAVEATGTLVVGGGVPGVVVRVDPQTGARTIVSDATTGSGPRLMLLRGMAVEASGALVATGLKPPEVGGGPILARVDPQTGDRTVVSDATTGSGPPFGPLALQGLAVESAGDLVVIDDAHDTVVRVDAVTGDRTVISASAVIGSGPALVSGSIAASATGTLFVAGRGFLFQVDPHTGMRRVVTDQLFDSFSDIAVEASGTVIGVWVDLFDIPCRGKLTRADPATGMHHSFGPACPITVAVEATGSLVASFQGDQRHTFRPNMLVRLDPSMGNGTPIVTSRGPALHIIRNIAVESTGTFVVDSGLNAVVRINEQTGEQTIVSEATTGSGPLFQRLGNIEVEATGDLVTVDRVGKAVFRIHPVTGARTIVSSATIGRGPAFFTPSEIAVEPTGTLVVADAGLRAVVRVDPISGDRAIITR